MIQIWWWNYETENDYQSHQFSSPKKENLHECWHKGTALNSVVSIVRVHLFTLVFLAIKFDFSVKFLSLPLPYTHTHTHIHSLTYWTCNCMIILCLKSTKHHEIWPCSVDYLEWKWKICKMVILTLRNWCVTIFNFFLYGHFWLLVRKIGSNDD